MGGAMQQGRKGAHLLLGGGGLGKPLPIGGLLSLPGGMGIPGISGIPGTGGIPVMGGDGNRTGDGDGVIERGLTTSSVFTNQAANLQAGFIFGTVGRILQVYGAAMRWVEIIGNYFVWDHSGGRYRTLSIQFLRTAKIVPYMTRNYPKPRRGHDEAGIHARYPVYTCTTALHPRPRPATFQ